MISKNGIRLQKNLILLACDKRWPFFIQQLNLLLSMGIAPRAVLIEPHRKYFRRRLLAYNQTLQNSGVSRLLYRIKIDILDGLEKIGVVDRAGSSKSIRLAGCPALYTCGTRTKDWKPLRDLDQFSLEQIGTEVIYCENNSDVLINYINDNRIEYVLAGAAQVLRKPLFTLTSAFFLNMHPGVLPYMRGMHSDKWALYYGVNPGATLHVMDAGVDTGPIIATGVVPISVNDTIASLRVKSHELCLSLLKSHLPRILSGELQLSELPKQDLHLGKITGGMGPLRFLQCNIILWILQRLIKRRNAIGIPMSGLFSDMESKNFFGF